LFIIQDNNILKRSFTIIEIVLFSFAILVTGQISTAQNYTVIRSDFFFSLSDGVKLDCTKFAPGYTDKDKLPAVIFCHGFGGSKNDEETFAQSLAEKGVITFTYSMRGQGKSTGYSNLISRTEMNDLIQLVDFIKKDPNIDTSGPGILGSSQGGIIPFMAACCGENFKFLVSDLASPEFASSWIENGSVKTTLIWSLMYDTSKVRYSNEVRNYRRWILSKRPDYRDSLETYFPRDRDFSDRVKFLNSPILIANSWQDKFFNTLGIIKSLDFINVPYRAYFGAVPGHGSDTIGGEIQFHSKNIDTWINYWLFGIDDPENTQSKFVYASSTNPVNFHHWNYVQSVSDIWPPERITKIRFYFQPGQKFIYESNQAKQDTISILNDVRDKNLTMQEAMNSNFSGNDFNNKFVKTFIYFETEPLEKDLKMIGSPNLSLFYTSDANICQLNFQIWEVGEDNQMNFVTRLNFTDWHLYTKSVKEKFLFGLAHSHIFKKGSRIRVYVTNIDNGPYDEFLRSNPFVLPVLKRARNIIYMNGNLASFLELPVQ
jgi:predicted acyl esterase